MESRENPIFGRKVFFLNPPLNIESSVIPVLKENEYEVYIIRDYRDAKPILKLNKDAICFINPDRQLPLSNWYNFIQSFRFDDVLKTIFLGVLSVRMNPSDREKFCMDLSLPGGMIMLDEKIEQITEKIIKILDINGAKGRRQYIRLNCRELDCVKGYITTEQNRMFFFNVNDISSVGFSCVYDSSYDSLLVKNSVIKEVSLELINDRGRKTISVPSLVYEKKVLGDSNLAVFLFTKEVPATVRIGIRNFIFYILEKQTEDFMHSNIKDMTDYSVLIESEPIIINEIEDVEELDDSE